MPRMVLGARLGNAQEYTLGGTQTLHIEVVSLTVDTNSAADTSYVDVFFLAPNGQTIAQSRTSDTVTIGEIATVTLAPLLPDTQELGIGFFTNVNTSGLVETVLPPLCTVRATASDPAAIVTEMRLWVDDVIDDATAADDEAATLGNWALVPGAGA